MIDKLGRNDTCSCGSGKKYKKCCMPLSSTSFAHSDVADFEWRKVRQLEGAVIDKHLIPYVMKTLPEEVMPFAINDCLPEDLPEEIDKGILLQNFLMPWIFFNWIPDENFGLTKFNPEITISENYLRNYKAKLNGDEIHFLEAMLTTFYSFYVILDVVKDQSLLIKDVLLSTEHRVKERQGTHFLKRGDIIFSRILTLNNQSIFIGMAPLTMPPQYHTSLLDFKKWLIEENDGKPLDGYVLRNELDLDIYDYFFEAIIKAYNDPLPTLANTDGDLFQLTTSHFKLSVSPEEALNQLISLTLSDDLEEFLHDAKRNKSGKITEIQIPWLKKGNKKHKHWDNTLYGEITIKENKLILKTNSAERSEKGKKLLKKLLGHHIEFQKSLIESAQQKMKALAEKNDRDTEPELNPMDVPEIQEKIKAMAKAHWDSWFDILIPALDDKTPRQAAKTKKGRELLEALLLQYERMDDIKHKNDPFRADIDFIKTTLKLKK